MIVRRLSGGPFFTYARLDRELAAPAGLTVVVGENGAGKSAGSYEFLSWVLYGQTVRGSKVSEAAGAVDLEVGGAAYRVERSRTARSQKLSLRCGPLDLTGATVTETQHKVDQLLGTHAWFCRARVFARDLLAKMALATDKERKALLEEVLGLEQFNRALAAGREELSAATARRNASDLQVPAARERVQAAETRVQLVSSRQVRDPVEVQVQLEAVAREHAAAKAHHAPAEARAQFLAEAGPGAVRAKINAEVRARQLRAEVAQLKSELAAQDRGCQACGRPFDEASRREAQDRLGARLLAAEDGLRGAAREAEKAALVEGTLREEVEELAEAARRHERAQADRRDLHTRLKGELELARTIAEQRDEAQRVLLAERDQLAAYEASRDAAARVVSVLSAACDALGLRGARCLLLARALGEVEAVANAVMARLHPAARVRLSGTTQQASGKEVDAVSITVSGAGGPDGDYRGCSTGEKVRVDVALMMGLAAAGDGSGLLVFDEVFDSLDRRGVEAVAEYVNELARSRQVVVVSHREDMVELLPRAAHWRARFDDVSTLEDA